MSNSYNNVPKDKFKATANKLLNECFILKKHKDTTSDYALILNNRAAFADFFDWLGYELLIDEANGVITINNPTGTGRIRLKKIESILLLILRVLYVEKRKQLSQTDDVVIVADEIYDKYNMLKINNKLDKITMRNALGMFQRYRLISKLSADVSNPDTTIKIHPSILFAVTTTTLDEMYETAKEKLNKYAIGGESDNSGEATADEEINED